jgi:hypothetical protein
MVTSQAWGRRRRLPGVAGQPGDPDAGQDACWTGGDRARWSPFGPCRCSGRSRPPGPRSGKRMFKTSPTSGEQVGQDQGAQAQPGAEATRDECRHPRQLVGAEIVHRHWEPAAGDGSPVGSSGCALSPIEATQSGPLGLGRAREAAPVFPSLVPRRLTRQEGLQLASLRRQASRPKPSMR